MIWIVFCLNIAVHKFFSANIVAYTCAVKCKKMNHYNGLILSAEYAKFIFLVHFPLQLTTVSIWENHKQMFKKVFENDSYAIAEKCHCFMLLSSRRERLDQTIAKEWFFELNVTRWLKKRCWAGIPYAANSTLCRNARPPITSIWSATYLQHDASNHATTWTLSRTTHAALYNRWSIFSYFSFVFGA